MVCGVMNKQLLAVGFILFLSTLTALVGNAQGSKPPRKVETSTGIYDVQSPDDIHKFSAKEIQTLIQMEKRRHQGGGTVPHPVLVYCFEEKTFPYTGGKYKNTPIKYRLRKPQTIHPDQQYPLIIHLHGGRNDSIVHLHSILPMLIGPDQKDFFLLATECPKNTPWWSFHASKDGTLDILMAALEHVLAENPIDEDRITVTGISSGGYGVWQLLLRHPDLFAGAVPTACEAPRQLLPLAALRQTQIWSFINKGDINPQSIRSVISMINNSGGSMALTECNAFDHNAWRPAMEDYNALGWMLAQKKGSRSSPPPGVVVRDSKSFLLAFVMHFLPLAIIVFLLWKMISDHVLSVY